MGGGKKPDGRKSKECKLGRFTKSTGLNRIPRPPAKALPQKALLFPTLGREGECEIQFSMLGGEGRITDIFFIKWLLPKISHLQIFIPPSKQPPHLAGQGWRLSGSGVKAGKVLEQCPVWPLGVQAHGSSTSLTGGHGWKCWPRTFLQPSAPSTARQGHRETLPSLHPAGDGMNPLFSCLRI